MSFAPIGANAQSITYTFPRNPDYAPINGVVSCGPFGISNDANGTIAWDLPATSPNVSVSTGVVDQATLETHWSEPQLSTIGPPFQGSSAEQDVGFPVPNVAPFYVAGWSIFPYENGRTVGSGVMLSGGCYPDGTGYFFIYNDYPAPEPTQLPIPATSHWMLLSLSLLIPLFARLASKRGTK